MSAAVRSIAAEWAQLALSPDSRYRALPRALKAHMRSCFYAGHVSAIAMMAQYPPEELPDGRVMIDAAAVRAMYAELQRFTEEEEDRSQVRFTSLQTGKPQTVR